MNRLACALFGAIFASGLAYIGWGAFTYRAYSQAFSETKQGQSMSDVLNRFGSPSHIEPHFDVPGYGAGSRSVCGEQCWLRLWYERPLTLGTSPVTIDFNMEQKVIDKYEWNSP